jgi:hypothetical protein
MGMSEELLRKLEQGVAPEDLEALTNSPEMRSWLEQQERIARLGARVVSTTKLRDLNEHAIQAGFNRVISAEVMSKLRRSGRHMLSPAMEHTFAEGVEQAFPHIRTEARLMLNDGSVEVTTLDIEELSFKKLKRMVEPRAKKPDPEWQHVLEMLREIAEEVPTHFDRMYPKDFAQGWVHDPEWAKLFTRERLSKLAPYWVTRDTQTLIEFAAESISEYQLRLDDALTPSGLAVLDRILYVGDLPVRAFSWDLTSVQLQSNPSRPAMFLVAWVDTAHDEARVEGVLEAGYRSRLFPTLAGVWFEDESMTDWSQLRSPSLEDRDAKLHIEVRQFMAAFWLLAQQRVALTSGRKPARGLRRAAERAKLPSEVVVVTLRRALKKEPETGEVHEVEWSHRWLVTGHWRHIWSEKEQRINRIWISSYVKGPENKPLVLKERMYKFSR